MALRRLTRTPAPAGTYDDDEDRPRKAAGSIKKASSNGGGLRRPSRDEDDERPRRAGRLSSDGAVSGGWGAYKRIKESMPSDFPDQLKVGAERTVIKFLENEPFATYKQHWADWMPRGSKLSYTCGGEDCPICDEVGQKPDFKSCFNVVDFTDPNHPVVKILMVGMTVGDMIFNFNEDDTTGPIDGDNRYFVIWMSGNKKGRKQTNLQPVKARDLEEDYSISPLTKDEIRDLKDKLWDASALPATDRKKLKEVAAAADD